MTTLRSDAVIGARPSAIDAGRGTWDLVLNLDVDGVDRMTGRQFVPYVQDPPLALAGPRSTT